MTKSSKIQHGSVKLMYEKVCQFSRRYLQRYGGYSRKIDATPPSSPGGRGLRLATFIER